MSDQGASPRGTHYEIKIEGLLTEKWSSWFAGMRLSFEQADDSPPMTVLTGFFIDQAELRGVLNKIWNLNLSLTSIRRVEPQKAGKPMDFDYILPLNDPHAGIETVGGKGASLARLATSGLPVPQGFHVTTGAYRKFVADNGLQPRISKALEPADAARPESLQAASEAIQELFAEAQIPPEVASEIVQAYAALPGKDPAVAVRSSATAEDLPETSFAGQQETYLNVSGAADVLEATKKCWASLWTARAIGYRARQGVPAEGLALAVVVQKLIPAEAAGILFTANPVTGRRDQILINAAWGLGDAVVGGRVTPDSITVDKEGGAILAQEIADKQVMTVRVNGGTREEPVPENLRRVPVLDDDAAAELARLGARIERLYDMPMDIEWALADGEFAIVQARPITALPEPGVKPPTEWPLPSSKGLFTRGSVADFLPDPLTPLFSTMALPAINAALDHLMDEQMGLKGLVSEGMLFTINDYAYMSLQLSLGQWILIAVKMVPAIPRLMRTAEHRWKEVARPNYLETVARWEGKPLTSYSGAELRSGVQQILEAMALYLTTLQSGTMGAAGGSEALFTAVYDRLAKREGDPPAPTFLLGFESIPIRAEKALYDLSQWCRARAGLAGYLLKTPTAKLIGHLEAGETPAGVPAEDWESWRQGVQDHLQEYGYLIYDLDFAKPLPMDDPTPTLEVIKMYLAGGGVDPHERQRDFAERREAAVQATLGRLRGLKLKIFRKVLGWAQWLAPLREDGIADIGLGYPQIRRMLLELGQRFSAAGVLDAAEDIFWLRRDEVEEATRALDHGEAPRCLSDVVQPRRAVWRAEKQATPPPQLPPSKKMMGLDMSQFLPVEGEKQTGDMLKGVGASPGRVTAAASVLHGPEDFDQMRPGFVLVANVTTPAWTPLFTMASGVVTDVGGPLSHGSIVAREYGIPAVLGTGVATRRIQSGQRISVDGDAGLVTIHGDG